MTWETAQFDSIIGSRGVGSSGLQKKEWKKQGRFPVIGQGEDYIEGWTDEEDLVINPSDGLVLYGGHTRRAKYVTIPFVPGPNVKVLETPSEIKSKFLFYFLNWKSIPNKGYADHFPLVRKIQIPLPPIKEQERIIAILDDAAEVERKRNEANQKLTTIKSSVFDTMFNKTEWPIVKLGEVATVKIGPFGTQLHAHDYVEDGVPIVNPTHIIGGRILVNPELTVNEQKLGELSQYIMHTGDVVLARRGEMGRCAVVSQNEDGYICGTGSLFITPTEKINSLFLGTLLSSKGMKKQLEENARGVTMKNLNINIVSNLKIALPSIELQYEYAERIKELKDLEFKQRNSGESIKALSASLLSKSFS